MKRISLIWICLLSISVYSQGIEFFKGSFEEAKAKAKKDGKIIFMDAYTSWCGPCIRMARNVFPTKEAGDYFNENFINVKMDMEKGEGKAIAKKYRVNSYPTLLFLDHNGDIVFKSKGARSNAAGLIELGKKALKPTANKLENLDKEFENGKREISFLKNYIQVKNQLGINSEKFMSAFISSLNASEIEDPINLKFVLAETKHLNAEVVDFIKDNKSVLINESGKEKFDEKISDVALKIATESAEKKNLNSLDQVKDFLKTFKPIHFKKQLSYIDTKYYGITKDWNNYDKSISKYLKKYKKDDDKAYNAVAWNYYMNIDENKKLVKAEKWMQKAVHLNNSYSNNLTQAYLLYKMKRYSEAQDAVEYALILSKDSEKNTKNAQILKEKIEEALKGEIKEVVIDYQIDEKN